MFTSMKQIHWVSGFGIFAYILGYIAIFIYGAKTYGLSTKAAENMLWMAEKHDVGARVMQLFGVMSFALGIPVLAYQIQESMEDQQKFRKTAETTLAFVCVAYIAIGVIGVTMFHGAPHGVQGMIISNLDSTSVYAVIVKVLVSITLFATMPVGLIPVVEMMEAIVLNPDQLSLRPGETILGGEASSSSFSSASSVYFHHDHINGVQNFGTTSSATSSSSGYRSYSTHPAYGSINDDLLESQDVFDWMHNKKKQGKAYLSGPSQYEQRTLLQKDEIGPIKKTPSAKIGLRGEYIYIDSENGYSPTNEELCINCPNDQNEDESWCAKWKDILGNWNRRYEGVWVARQLVKLFIPVTVLLIAVLIPCFTLVMSLLGCVTVGGLSFILPPLFYLKLAKESLITPESFDKFMCYVLFAFGIGVMLIGGGLILSNPKCH